MQKISRRYAILRSVMLNQSHNYTLLLSPAHPGPWIINKSSPLNLRIIFYALLTFILRGMNNMRDYAN